MGILLRIIRAATVIFSREELPQEPPGVPETTSANHGFLRWLLEPEELPQDPQLPRPQRGSFFSWLLSKEDLAEDPMEIKGRKGFWETVFQPESLPGGEGDGKKGGVIDGTQ